MKKIWKCKIGGEVVGDLPAGADGPMRRAVQTAFETLTGVEASFTFSGWGATLTEGERAAHENREPNWDAMQEALGAGDGTLHGAIEYWHAEALRLRAELAECKRDAERYRFLRAHWDHLATNTCYENGEYHVIAIDLLEQRNIPLNLETLDAEIDAALAAKGEGK